MATLKTQGFALSSLPRSPAIPSNVGAVDVKEIYDGVRQGLAAYENVRRAPASMLLADATLAEQTAEAPLKARQVLAQTEGIEQQTPLRTSILAAEASPEMLQAKRTALLAKTVKPLTGTPYLLNRMDELRAALAANPTDTSLTAAIADTQAALNKMQAVDPAAALKSKETVAAAANTTKENVAKTAAGAASVPKSGLAAVIHRLISEGYDVEDPVIQGLLLKQSATEAADPAAERASREKVAQDRITAQAQATQANRDQKLSLVNAQHQQKLSHSLGALETLENNTAHVEDLISQAIKSTDNLSAGYGSVLSGLPKTEARKLRGILDSIRANIGFDALAAMRQNSPTGGALGAVSDTENKLLQSTIEALDQGGDPEVLKTRLASVLEQRRKSLANLQRTYERDVDALSLKPAGVAAVAPALPTFGSAQEADAAGAAGTIAPGAKIIVNGQSGTWNP